MSIFDFSKNPGTMDKNESPQALILDLVLHRGCEVTLRPVPNAPSAFYLGIRHQDKQIVRGIETLCLDKDAAERAACHTIKWAAEDLLGKDYRRTVHRNIEEELP